MKLLHCLPALIVSWCLLLLPSPAHAQAAEELILVAHQDSVLIHLGELPVEYYGFVVYRGPPGAAETLITDEPVLPVLDPTAAAAWLGGDLPRLLRAIDLTDEASLVRRLHSDPFASRVMSVLSRPAAQVAGRFFADAEPPPLPALEYRIVFVDAEGAETTEVLSGVVQLEEIAPDLPVTLEGTPGHHQALIAIAHPPRTDDSDLVVGFGLERAEAPPEGAAEPDSPVFRRVTDFPILRSTGPVTTFVDSEVINDRRYLYRVRPVDLAQRTGPVSDLIEVEPFDPRPPSRPARVVTDAGEATVRIDWPVSPEPSVVGYRIERSTGLGEPFEALNEEPIPPTTPGWRDDTVTGGVQYFYRVVAINARGLESPPSTAMSALPVDLTPPGAPVGLSYEVDARSVSLAWTPPEDEGLLGYHVYRGDDPERVLRLTREAIPEPIFFDEGFEGAGLNPGFAYTYHVTAVDLSYNESEPGVVEVLIPDDEPPAPPTALQLRSVLGREIELRWSPGPSLDVVSYRVERFAVDPALPVIQYHIPHEGELVVRDTSGLVTGEEYRYTVTAVDGAGNESLPAEGLVVFRDPSPPPAPRHVEARLVSPPGPGTGVLVVWERVVHPELVGYRVYRAALPTGAFEPVSDLISAEDAREFIDADGEAGWFYRVRALTRSGVTSAASPSARAIP
jgi:fibronectin type 3 domain-containing protein